ncbi:MAG: hypothetical protein H7A01_03930 [Hahellaceae bacterium]|nr:hypothetical protein [Hahellaceae bacterium]MCP5213154.1 hypothetical protein [Hahellaceae bacterium]
MKHKHLILAFLSTCFITACGSGGNSEQGCSTCEGTQQAVDSFPSSRLVSTELKELSQQVDASICSGRTLKSTYLESENTRIFATPEIVESSMQLLATLTEEKLAEATNAFGMSLDSYIELRGAYDLGAAYEYVYYVWQAENADDEIQIYELEPGFDVSVDDLPTVARYRYEYNSDTGDYDRIITGYDPYLSSEIASEYWGSLTASEKSEAIARVAAFRDESVSMEDYAQEPRIHVCVLDKSVFEGIATVGSKDGMQIANPSQLNEYNQSDNFSPFARVIEHELIHVIQNSYMSAREVSEYVWFAEGIAEYLTGGKITLSAHEENIVETGRSGNLWFDKYSYAAGVIYYITQTLGNGDGSILQFLENYKNQTYLEYDIENEEYKSLFESTFSNTFIDFDLSQFEYSELESEYFERLN